MISSDGSECSKKHSCEACNYHTSRLSQLTRHLSSAKHQMITNGNPNGNDTSQKGANAHVCNCGNFYNFSSGLSRHRKKCTYQEPPVLENTFIEPEKIDKRDIIIEELVKTQLIMKETNDILKVDNHEMKNLIMLLVEKYQQSTHNTVNTTNSHNNNNTLNFYLTQTCKNAESIHDFTDRFVERSSEFFNNNYMEIASDQTNFAAGVMDIFWKCMEEKPQIEKFIQTTDVKNGVLYVKEKKKDEQRRLIGEAEFVKHMDGFEKAGLNLGHEMNKAFLPMKMKFVETMTAECGSPPDEDDFDNDDDYENALHKFKERVMDMKQRLSRQTHNAVTLFDIKQKREEILFKTKRIRQENE